MLSAFLQSPKTIGALARYSKHSINIMLSNIDRNQALNILEYGPGNGNITTTILSKMNAESQLTVFELNQDIFEKKLSSIEDTRLTIHYKSCEQVADHVTANSIDLVVSTIPLSLLDKHTVSNIMKNSYNILAPEGKFVTAQYNLTAEQALQNQFGNTSKAWTRKNFPPIYVITSTKEITE